MYTQKVACRKQQKIMLRVIMAVFSLCVCKTDTYQLPVESLHDVAIGFCDPISCKRKDTSTISFKSSVRVRRVAVSRDLYCTRCLK